MAGAGYKLFNTGDVLTAAQVNTYLMEQTVMVFADAAARTTALAGVVSEGMISYLKDTNAVEVYNGSAWVASDDPNAIQNTIVDAKGDLIAASAADTPARLAAGNNGDTLVADSAATVGLRYSGGVGLGNPVINSAFQIAQRGTSVSVAASTTTYTLDRWKTATGANQACTVSREATGDTTNLPNIQYCMRYQRNSGQTGTSGMSTYQDFETINSVPFSGKTVTISVYARKGADYSPTSSILQFNLINGTGTDQTIYSGYTGQNNVISQNMTLTTTWQRFTYTGTVPTNSTQLAIGFGWSFQGTAGAADYFEVTGVQIDIGSVALPFRTQNSTIQGELAACQRYYWRLTGGSNYAPYGNGIAYSSTNARIIINHPTMMRIPPSSVDYANLLLSDATNNNAVTSLTIEDKNENKTTINAVVASGLTQYRPVHILNNNAPTTGYFGFSAEL